MFFVVVFFGGVHDFPLSVTFGVQFSPFFLLNLPCSIDNVDFSHVVVFSGATSQEERA